MIGSGLFCVKLFKVRIVCHAKTCQYAFKVRLFHQGERTCSCASANHYLPVNKAFTGVFFV